MKPGTPGRLRYVTLGRPGIAREKRGAGFSYRQPTGRPMRDGAALERIRRLAIPPAWTRVWICPFADGHIQATGRDARGRLQYRYHADWRAARDATKFDRMLEFGRALPKIRRQVTRDLRRPPLSREAVLATVVRLLEITLIRIGSEEYARTNHSYGLTTLRDRHVSVTASALRFHFRGKSGKIHEVALHDRRLAQRVRRLQDLPGQELFQWADDGHRLHPVTSGDVNDYLHAVAGEEFSAKDFRTWAGTLAAASAMSRAPARQGRLTRRQINEVVALVAAQLGNTPAICRKSYIHPAVIECGQLGIEWTMVPSEAAHSVTGLSPAEKSLVQFLRERRSPPTVRKQLEASLAPVAR